MPINSSQRSYGIHSILRQSHGLHGSDHSYSRTPTARSQARLVALSNLIANVVRTATNANITTIVQAGIQVHLHPSPPAPTGTDPNPSTPPTAPAPIQTSPTQPVPWAPGHQHDGDSQQGSTPSTATAPVGPPAQWNMAKPEGHSSNTRPWWSMQRGNIKVTGGLLMTATSGSTPRREEGRPQQTPMGTGVLQC